MRLEEPFVYEITTPREIPALFKFMMEAGPITLREAYATYNMGVGFAAFVSPAAVDATLAAARAAGPDAWVAGRVKKEKMVARRSRFRRSASPMKQTRYKCGKGP